MNKAMLLSTALGFLAGPVFADDNLWKYVVINPDGTQASASQVDLSYPPASDYRGSPRRHLIIMGPEGGLPEPMILINKAALPAATKPAADDAPSVLADKKADAPAMQRVPASPPRRAFVLY